MEKLLYEFINENTLLILSPYLEKTLINKGFLDELSFWKETRRGIHWRLMRGTLNNEVQEVIQSYGVAYDFSFI
ncbi:hypothetical protein COI93_19080 [Bacillus cereus]|uniref:Uncharacterized protein n=1 Tax=Bacillus cereus TaxID=1396 RepID=A0A2B0LVZ0_BACCE|nr:hypothetical protein COI93_19080 [Bacillus cereus]